MISLELVQSIRRQFALEWNGIHGEPHWVRVLENGLRLADTTGAKKRVVELFAFLHDSRRLKDGPDPEHGARAAQFAEKLAGREFKLPAKDLQLLLTACRGPVKGTPVSDITILTCWDADRLDQGRVGSKPDPKSFHTDAARDPAILEWAYRRSVK